MIAYSREKARGIETTSTILLTRPVFFLDMADNAVCSLKVSRNQTSLSPPPLFLPFSPLHPFCLFPLLWNILTCVHVQLELLVDSVVSYLLACQDYF